MPDEPEVGDKADVTAYQPDFLRECAAARDAGFPPQEPDTTEITDPAEVDRLWDGAER